MAAREAQMLRVTLPAELDAYVRSEATKRFTTRAGAVKELLREAREILRTTAEGDR